MRKQPKRPQQPDDEKSATFNAAFIKKRSVDSPVRIMTKGKGSAMKSFKGKLTKEETTAVAASVRELAEKYQG